ncbi:MAG: hypothetical protein F6K24_40845, partial [Okeania sp. SIO2D1]|nr:hypothetical protein [Okeania sp. SIO2D1]
EQKNVASDTKLSKDAESSNCLDENSLDNRIEIAQGAGKAKRVSVNAVQGLTHTEVLTDFHTLKSNDARAAFARTWLAKSSEALNETWSVIYELLKLVEEGELYKKESSLNNSKIYNSFQEYFQDTLKHPFGSSKNSLSH